MANYKCPKCGIGVMHAEVLAKHTTNLNGIQLEIPNAKVSRCPNCGEITVSAKELKRWESLQRDLMTTSGQLPSPKEVKRLREGIALSVSDFAILLGVTRQTVHAWERADSSGIGLGPAAILLVLIREELEGKVGGALDALVNMARLRGHEIHPRSSGPSGGAPPSVKSFPPAIRIRCEGAPGFVGSQPTAA